MRSLRIISCLALVAIATVSNCRAQEIGSLDHTKGTAYSRELRRPAASTPGTRWLGAVFADYPCADATRKMGALQTKIEFLDRQRYRDGDWLTFEVTIKDVGCIPLKIPFSIDLADLQPEDAAQGFGYSALSVSLWAAASNDPYVIGLVAVRIYGAEDRPNTMVTLSPGQWVRIAGRDKIHFPADRTALDLINSGAFDHAYPQVSVYHSETLLTSASSATDSREICIRQTRGKGFPIALATPEQ
jgi:hypothetical protein